MGSTFTNIIFIFIKIIDNFPDFSFSWFFHMKSMFAKVAHPNIAVGKSKNYFTHLELLTVIVALGIHYLFKFIIVTNPKTLFSKYFVSERSWQPPVCTTISWKGRLWKTKVVGNKLSSESFEIHTLSCNVSSFGQYEIHFDFWIYQLALHKPGFWAYLSVWIKMSFAIYTFEMQGKCPEHVWRDCASSWSWN